MAEEEELIIINGRIPCQVLVKLWRFCMMNMATAIETALPDEADYCRKMYVDPLRRYVSRTCYQRTVESINFYRDNVLTDKKTAWRAPLKIMARYIDRDLRRYGIHQVKPLAYLSLIGS